MFYVLTTKRGDRHKFIIVDVLHKLNQKYLIFKKYRNAKHVKAKNTIRNIFLKIINISKVTLYSLSYSRL